VRRDFGRGAYLVEAGCLSEAIYLVRNGYVRIFLLAEDGRETTTAILGPGQLVGVTPLLGEDVHHEFAQALTRVEVWALSMRRSRDSLAEDQILRGLVLGSLAQRFAVAVALLRDVALLPVAERVHDIETRLTASLRGSPLALKRTTLAGLVQARPETLARAHPIARPLARTAVSGPQAQAGIDSANWVFQKGHVLLEADLPAGHAGRVVSGEVQVSVAGAGDRQMVVEYLDGGDLFGIGALLGMPPAGIRLTALSDGEVELLSGGELLRRLADEPTALGPLLSRLGWRLEQLERRLARAAAPEASQRLMDLLRELAARDPQPRPGGARVVPGGWSHAALAHQIGVSRETVTRALAELSGAGAIRRQGRRILVVSGLRGLRSDGGGRREPSGDCRSSA
jgi:CRP-like cAMP-binding protein